MTREQLLDLAAHIEDGKAIARHDFGHKLPEILRACAKLLPAVPEKRLPYLTADDDFPLLP